jgi:hypothetical protein
VLLLVCPPSPPKVPLPPPPQPAIAAAPLVLTLPPPIDMESATPDEKVAYLLGKTAFLEQKANLVKTELEAVKAKPKPGRQAASKDWMKSTLLKNLPDVSMRHINNPLRSEEAPYDFIDPARRHMERATAYAIANVECLKDSWDTMPPAWGEVPPKDKIALIRLYQAPGLDCSINQGADRWTWRLQNRRRGLKKKKKAKSSKGDASVQLMFGCWALACVLCALFIPKCLPLTFLCSHSGWRRV